jgi:uncharacterized protein (DUF302 family)
MGDEQSVEGMLVLHTERSVPGVMERLKEMMKARGIRVFAHLDFSADAAAEGIALRPTQMLIAGAPKAGTPLIEATPSIAIDLPLKILAWSEQGGRTTVAYNDPQYLQRRHGFPAELVKNIAGMALIIAAAAGS